MSTRLPDFLIAGAAKCGTTAVAEYIGQHPRVYMSPLKEPKFMSSHFMTFPYKGPGDDFVEAFTIKDFKEYKQLFRWARGRMVLGEASVESLYYHDRIIPLIKRYLGDIKIIIVLRNPVDRAFSAYKMLVRDGRETCTFEEALEKEEERKGKNWEYIWHLKDGGFYYDQVKGYLESFSDVKVMLFEDLRDHAVAFMQELYRFLGVRDNFVPKISLKLNSSGALRNGFYRLLFRATGFKGMLYKFLSLNGVSDSVLLNAIEAVRDGELEPMHLQAETRIRLARTYQKDILKLQELIGRDLSAWLH